MLLLLLLLLLNINRIGAEYEGSDLISDFLLQNIISSYLVLLSKVEWEIDLEDLQEAAAKNYN